MCQRLMVNMQVAPRIVLITGAAKGIGKAIAIELAKNQYAIVLNYHHSKKEALSLKEEIQQKYSVPCMAIQADVSKEQEVDRMVKQVEKELG